MSWKYRAKQGRNGEAWPIPSAGPHKATIVALIGLGTHAEQFKDEKTGKIKNVDYAKILLLWELHDEIVPGTKDRRFLLSKDYRIALGPRAALRLLMEGLRGTAYKEGEEMDVGKLLGMPCLLSVKHGQSKSNPDRTYAFVDGVMAYPKKDPKPPPHTKPYIFDIAQGDRNFAILDDVPYLYGEPITEVMKRSREWHRAHATDPRDDNPPANDGDSDHTDMPF